MSGYKSHTAKEIAKAVSEGKEVWALDTAGFGADDHLIGTEDEVRSEILDHHDLEEWPESWTLDRV